MKELLRDSQELVDEYIDVWAEECSEEDELYLEQLEELKRQEEHLNISMTQCKCGVYIPNDREQCGRCKTPEYWV